MVRIFRPTELPEEVGPSYAPANMDGCGIVLGLLLAVPLWLVIWLVLGLVFGA
jgi:hypothetical protein